ncbi:caspase family protein [Rhizobium sp. PP-CC-3G-465]|uniref:caspase family protein n=1 Tax=Rhizobium sp. PP-CC-3G-465 TaxID=2135648 RepID=UPI001052FD1C|nr:hypothetical protein C8J33_11525 [Rhizobium sp. PP-CC-3G-465]
MLYKDAESRGSWTDGEAAGNGAHVMIVGVSHYPHLANGSVSELAPDNGGLGQLEASALTAAKIFAALNAMGSIAGCKIKTCRICLSPSQTEQEEVDVLTEGHFSGGGFEEVRNAILGWGTDIHRGGRKKGENVAVFFFSGHGVEHLGAPALLVGDILNPDNTNRNNLAISHDGLVRAVKTLGVDRGLFLIDACRDAPEIAKRLRIVGQPILDPDADQSKSPEAMLSLLSTRQLFQSYQVRGARQTLFGQALLEALEGQPPTFLPYDAQTDPLLLRFGKLESHVKQRVRELLAEQTASKLQPVSPAGDPYDGEMLVAEKALPGSPQPSRDDPEKTRSFNSLVASRRKRLAEGFSHTTVDVIAALRDGPAGTNDLANYAMMHEIFQHEDVTLPWIDGITISDVESGMEIDHASLVLVEGRTKATHDRVSAWIDISIKPDAGKAVWISAKGSDDSRITVAVPRDLDVDIPVRLDVELCRDGGGAWIVESMFAWLGKARDRDSPWLPLREVQDAELLSDLGSAGRIASRRKVLEMTLFDKRRSPVAAAVAASTLLRSNYLIDLHDWPRNLADRFGWLPDGNVLWAETLIRRRNAIHGRYGPEKFSTLELSRTPELTEAREYFSRLADRGMPLLAASMQFAIGQLPLWRSLLENYILSSAEQQALADSCELIERSAQSLVSGSLFAGFVLADNSLNPGEILGRRKPRQRIQQMAAE